MGIIKLKSTILAIIASVLIIAGLSMHASAANVSMAIRTSSSTVTSGSTFTATVRLNLGTNSTLDALANLNYDSSKLQYVSVSYAPSSGWASSGPEAGPSSGHYRVDVLTNGDAKSGDIDLATITFKALASSGSTELTLDNVSVSDGSVPPPAVHTVSTTPTTISFAAPQTSPSPSPEPSPSSPEPSNPEPSQPTSNSNSAPEPSREATREQNASVADDEPVKTTNIEDKARYDIRLLILDKNNNPIKNTEVTLNEQKATTDANGYVEFDALPVGNYQLEVLGVTRTVEVSTGDPLVLQESVVSIDQQKDEEEEMPWLLYGSIAFGVIVLLVLSLLLIKWRRKRTFYKDIDTQPSSDGNSSNATDQQSIVTEQVNDDTFLRPSPPEPEKVYTPDQNNQL